MSLPTEMTKITNAIRARPGRGAGISTDSPIEIPKPLIDAPGVLNSEQKFLRQISLSIQLFM